MRRILALLSLSVCLFALPLSAAERGVKRVETYATAERHALVIGNSEYEQVGRLRNPVNDADAMTRTLDGLGFKVTPLKNADLRTMERTITAHHHCVRQETACRRSRTFLLCRARHAGGWRELPDPGWCQP